MKSTGYFAYGGNRHVRLREKYVRDVARPLIARGAVGALKLDIVLRGLASGANNAGAVATDIGWEDLHDLCRDKFEYLDNDAKMKRGWITDKLALLEECRLISRRVRPGRRATITVLADTQDGGPLDDPGAVADQYVTFIGRLAEFGHWGSFSASEVAAYFCGMQAERLAQSDPKIVEALNLAAAPIGGGQWYRPLHWFGDAAKDDAYVGSHVRYGFSERTLQRGFKSLELRGLLLRERIDADPRTGIPFEKGRRVLYHNRFAL